MTFNTLLYVFSLISIADGILAIFLPGQFMKFIWPQRSGPEAYLLIQGWGACLVALSVMAWTVKSVRHPDTRKLFALGLFLYFVIASAVWFSDSLAFGWTPVSGLTFAGLLSFAAAFGYFRFVNGLSLEKCD